MAVIRQTSYNSDSNKLRKKLQNHWGTVHTIQIYRQSKKNLGITVVGGKVNSETSYGIFSEDILGVFIKEVVPDSCAETTGQFKVGDRILEINGVDVKEANHDQVLNIIKNSDNPIVFAVQSLLPSFAFNDVQAIPSVEINEEITNTETVQNQRQNEKPPVSSDSESEEEDDEEDIREMEGRTMTAKGYMIDRASAGNVKRSHDEIKNDTEEEDLFGYTTSKIKKKYSNLSHNVITVQLDRHSQDIGISLAGHRDRNCMAVFVCGLNPNGSAYKAGTIQVGDEILEVNGVVLHGRCHLNASSIIKALPGTIFKFLLLRKKTGLEDIAVKPITQYPVSDIDDVSEEVFSTKFPNVRTVALTKQPAQSLGIMLIEGKHAGVGKGIFISDIQEGSTAEKVGLEIGEMLLAVNKDTLIGVTYEIAAGLLKNVSGLITLIVSNPEKKENKLSAPSSTVESGDKKTQVASTPKTSRSPTPVPDPAADPLVCAISEGKEVTIEIVTENKLLGIFFVGRKDDFTTANGVVLIEVYPGGIADKDKRLQPGDTIMEVNGVSLREVTFTTASQALRETGQKVRLIVYRPMTSEYTTHEVNLSKKPGRGLGLSLVGRKCGKGIYIADIISGGSAEFDGSLVKGDIITTVDDKDVQNCSAEEATVLIKILTGNVLLKINRYKLLTK